MQPVRILCSCSCAYSQQMLPDLNQHNDFVPSNVKQRHSNSVYHSIFSFILQQHGLSFHNILSVLAMSLSLCTGLHRWGLFDEWCFLYVRIRQHSNVVNIRWQLLSITCMLHDVGCLENRLPDWWSCIPQESICFDRTLSMNCLIEIRCCCHRFWGRRRPILDILFLWSRQIENRLCFDKQIDSITKR